MKTKRWLKHKVYTHFFSISVVRAPIRVCRVHCFFMRQYFDNMKISTMNKSVQYVMALWCVFFCVSFLFLSFFFLLSCFILKVLNHLWGVDNISNCNADSFEPILFTSLFFGFLLFIFILFEKSSDEHSLSQSVNFQYLYVCVWCAYACMQSYFQYFVCVRVCVSLSFKYERNVACSFKRMNVFSIDVVSIQRLDSA